MKITHEVERKVLETQDILCNRCGKSCMIANYPHGLIDAKVHGGYSSKAVNDGDIYKFDICEECFKKFAETFVIPAKIGNSWFSEEAEQDAKAIDEALGNLRNALKETAETVKDRLGMKDGFIKFGDKVEGRVRESIEKIKEKIQ
jgi:ribosomal-protein-alanine N-acetyltransferase